jgi:hypothetical protein
MALSDLFKGETSKGVAIGFAAAMLAPVVVPILTQTARTLIKTGILLYHKSRETLAEAEETFDDLVAEVRAELAEEQRPQEHTAQQVRVAEDEESP